MAIFAQLIVWSPVFAFVVAMFLYYKVRPTPKIPALAYTAIILVGGVVAFPIGWHVGDEFAYLYAGRKLTRYRSGQRPGREGLRFAMQQTASSVEFSPAPQRLGAVWTWIATHPSGQQEEIVGFTARQKRGNDA